MAKYQFPNNAASTLLSNVGPTDTAIVLPSTEGGRFPSDVAGTTFMVTVENDTGGLEIMECTHRAGDVLTVVRGREGTAAMAFTAGAIVECRLTAGILQYLDFVLHGDTYGGPAILDINGHLKQDQWQTEVTTYGDNRWNVKLGWTPVQQGTGIGQLPNVVKVGYKAGAKLGVTVDATDLGNVAFESWVTATATAFKASTLATPRAFSITTGPVRAAAINFDGSAPVALASTIAANALSISMVNGLQAALDARLLNTTDSLTGNLTVTGSITAASVTDTSDVRIKRDPKLMSPEDALAIVQGTRAMRFFNTATNRKDFGVIADDQQLVTPELVYEDAATMKSVAYQRLTAPLIVVVQHLLQRVAALEEKGA